MAVFLIKINLKFFIHKDINIYMYQLSEQCVITQISFNLPAKKQGYLACISSGHPWGLLGRRFSLLVASRPLTKKRITYRFKLLMLNSFF